MMKMSFYYSSDTLLLASPVYMYVRESLKLILTFKWLKYFAHVLRNGDNTIIS